MIAIDPTSAVAPFEQIRAQVADAIRAGDLDAGHRLPSIRQLAADLQVAAGTVARAYAELESEGMVRTSRVGGTTVAPDQAHAAQARAAAAVFVRSVGDDVDLQAALSAVRAAWRARPAAS